MDYSAWEATVPATITDDMLWKQIIRLLLTMIPDQRNRTLKEGSASYLPDDVPFPD